ncbi:MAG TPA: M48 family metalloprotease [Candidatus Angelobacter sp.]|nr:M48 family metalloprotease [Candidatus Angelobacter sp.]
MNSAEMPGKQAQYPGIAYTKRVRGAAEVQVFLCFLGIAAYGYFGLRQWSALASSISENLFVQVALGWIPIWTTCTLCSVLHSCYMFYVDRKFGLSRSSMPSRILESLKANAFAFAYTGTIIVVAFAAHQASSSFGWFWAGTVSTLLFLSTTATLPWILSRFYPLTLLRDTSLRERLTSLADKAGLQLGTIYQWHISSRTRQANALVTGVGATRRILLTDTLIGELSNDEVEAIVAHEFGHCALRHIWKRTLLKFLIFCGVFFVINGLVGTDLIWFADKNEGWKDAKLVPGIFFCWTIGNIYGNIIMAALARRQEKDADLYSWKLMGRTQPFITAMKKLSALNLITFDKSSQWKYMHPPTPDRIAAAQEYEKQHYGCVGEGQAAAQHSST